MSSNRILFALPLTALLLLCGTGWAQRPTPTPTPIPRSVLQTVERGNEAFQQGHLEQAISIYRNAIEEAPILADAHYRLGVALIYKERFIEAEKELKRALELDPNLVAAQNVLTKHAAEIAAAKSGGGPAGARAPVRTGTAAMLPSSATAATSPRLPGNWGKEVPPEFETYINRMIALGVVMPIVSILVWLASIALCIWLGTRRGHGLVWSILYGVFCSCCGLILVLLPPKVSRILVIITIVLTVIALALQGMAILAALQQAQKSAIVLGFPG